MLWWAHVTVTPEAKRMAVLRRGTSIGSRGLIPTGGHCPPSSRAGARLEWKKAQKKPKKKKASEAINRTMPYRSPFWTVGVWWPWNVLSRTMSRHHWNMTRAVVSKPMIRRYGVREWNHIVRPEVVRRAAAAPRMGHGLGSTMWYECAWCAIGVRCFLEGTGLAVGQRRKLGL